MRIWRIPMVCLDDRRLNAQHNEVHICLAVLERKAQGQRSGWANSPHATQWEGIRGALINYHNDIVLPACRRRFPASDAYHDHEFLDYETLPIHERNHLFWDHVTWDQILLDIRHLIEKHNRDAALVDLARRTGNRTRVIRPRGHNPRAIVAVLHRAISHVYRIAPDDAERLQLMALRLTSEKLLGEPSHSKTSPQERRELRTRKLIAAS